MLVRKIKLFGSDVVSDDEADGDMRNSDDEQMEEENETKAKWLTEHLEREKFLEPHRESDFNDNTDSQLLKPGKVIFKPKHGMSSING